MGTEHRMARRRTARALLSTAALAASFALPTVAHAKTVVSLTFDDARESEYVNARPLLDEHGMQGTFYVISSVLDHDPRSMTLAQVQALAADGHEIGGHTVLHHDLTAETSDEDQREICGDRSWLLAHGLSVYDLAYPYNVFDSKTEAAAAHCGYDSGRSGGELSSSPSCVAADRCAESIPPRDPYGIRGPLTQDDSMSLSDLEQQVTNVEDTGGGWVVMNFHDVCDGCSGPYRISPAMLNAFLDWLQPRAASGTVVKTVHDVVGGPLQPAVDPPPAPPPGKAGVNLLQDPSLEDAAPASHDETRAARCFVEHNDVPTTPATWTRTSDAHSGTTAVRVNVSAIDSWGFWALVPTLDLGSCAPSVVPGHVYQVSGWYKATAPVTLIGYYRDVDAQWLQLDHSGQFPASSAWRQASFTLPPMPADAAGMSAGFWFNQVGSLTMDDLSIVDTTAGGTGGGVRKVTLSIAGKGTGEVTSNPALLDCRASCSGSFPAGSTVTLTAAPDPGSSFKTWAGACSGTSRTCTLTVTAATRVTAKFGR